MLLVYMHLGRGEPRRVKRENSGRSRYEEIALDIARRIAEGDLGEGARVLGRSSLAGTYQVSPETIRRAVAILHERGIVQSVAGSGIRVLSRYAAQEFLETVQSRSSLVEGARELRALLKERTRLDEQINATLDKLLREANASVASRHIEEIAVPEGSWAAGRSLGEIRLRNRTGATAVAVSRGEEDFFSPPPDMRLEAGDVMTILGSEAARTRARQILSATAEPAE